jgi:penicillin-insensitive murein endopeptidase
MRHAPIAWLCRRLLLPATAIVLATGGTARADWGQFAEPSAAPPQAIGTHDRGCLAGGVALPLDGPGHQVMRVSRNRYYGHPDLIRFIETLAADLAAAGHPGLLIGDLAQPRGGPMRTGHRSHQSGLDVDIWFLPAPAPGLSMEAREQLSAQSQVAPGGRTVSDAWGPLQLAALRQAALSPAVDRIFVNAAIKREVCAAATGDRSWLGKIRPWWGHDAHFHVRLACPAGEADCVGQAPLPSGDGCDAGLDWWFSDEAAAELAKKSKAPPARDLTLADLPDACHAVHEGR